MEGGGHCIWSRCQPGSHSVWCHIDLVGGVSSLSGVWSANTIQAWMYLSLWSLVQALFLRLSDAGHWLSWGLNDQGVHVPGAGAGESGAPRMEGASSNQKKEGEKVRGEKMRFRAVTKIRGHMETLCPMLM